MSNSRRPLIGITMRVEFETDRFYLARFYSEAVEAAGGVPLHLSLIPREDYIREALESLDGLLLPGSDSDLDPMLYNKEPHRRLGSVHAIKDQTDLLALDEVEKRGLPLLAICFGMQALNVSRGGTLIQDIESELPEAIKHQQGAPRDRRSHRVRFLEGSLVREIAGAPDALVNSHHHQAIERVGRELVATAWTSDGLVEAIEDPRAGRFALAVQWHPEIAWENDDFSMGLFKRFVDASTEYKTARTINNSEPERVR
ncbi:MAG TPA: gamma-glutamyl-gamma-aminobutyrate hydrolase family protein [Pyrinomonadaceae bacterium]